MQKTLQQIKTVANSFGPATHYLTEKKFNVLRDYYIHVYDDNIEAQTQYYMMQGAVHPTIRKSKYTLLNVQYFFFLDGYKQDKTPAKSHGKKTQDKIYMDEFIFDFVRENLTKKGIADALQWDLERNPTA